MSTTPHEADSATAKPLEKYTTALQDHGNCYLCLDVHLMNGSTFCTELEKKLTEARDKVVYSPSFQVTLGWLTLVLGISVAS